MERKSFLNYHALRLKVKSGHLGTRQDLRTSNDRCRKISWLLQKLQPDHNLAVSTSLDYTIHKSCLCTFYCPNLQVCDNKYLLSFRVKGNPKTKATDGETELQLALNTAQVGRTFQDRTHVFLLKPRNILPKNYQNTTIKYIFGMGKRGNIQQAYPSMEYRFFPELLRVTTDDVVCFVWSGKSFWLNDQIKP